MAKRRKKRGGRENKGRSDKNRGSTDEEQPNRVLEWIKSLLIAGVLFLILRAFLVQTFVIISGSMEGTLAVGDYLLVNRVAIGSQVPFTDLRIPGYSSPKRLDVLVFDPHHEMDIKLVKRLMGMPGDTVSMAAGILSINGEALDEPYVKWVGSPDNFDPIMRWQEDFLHPSADAASYSPSRDTWGPLVIPEDRYLMLGDNRQSSYDSRYWGFLEGWRFEGRVSRVYFSYNMDSHRPFAVIREIRWSRLGDAIR